MASSGAPGGGGGGGGAKVGFDASDHRAFTRALQQQLFVQTPLQALLETLFERVQSQAKVVSAMQARMSGSPLAGGGGAASGDVDSRLREMELRHQEQALSLRKLEEHVLMLQNQLRTANSARVSMEVTLRNIQGGRVGLTSPGAPHSMHGLSPPMSPTPEASALAAGPAARRHPFKGTSVCGGLAGNSLTKVGTHSVEMAGGEAVRPGSGTLGGDALSGPLGPRRSRPSGGVGGAGRLSDMSGAGGGYGGSSFGGLGGVGGVGGGYGGYGDAAELEARVGALEAQLSGVSNLRGKLAALEHLATEVVGLPIPDVDADPTLDLDVFYLEEGDEEEEEKEEGGESDCAVGEVQQDGDGSERHGEEWEQAGGAGVSEGQEAARGPEGDADANGRRGLGRRAGAGSRGVVAAAAVADGLAQAPLATDGVPRESGDADGALGTASGDEPAAGPPQQAANSPERQNSRGAGGMGGDVNEAADEDNRLASAGSRQWAGAAEGADRTTDNDEEGEVTEAGGLSAAAASPEMSAAGENGTELGQAVDEAAEGAAHGKDDAAPATARRLASGAERPPALQLGEASAGPAPHASVATAADGGTAAVATAAARRAANRLNVGANGRTGSPIVGASSKTRGFKMPLTAHLESQLAELAARVNADSGELRSVVNALRRELRSLVGGGASGRRSGGDGDGKDADEPEGQEAAAERLGRMGMLEADLMYIREMLPEDGVVSRADFNTLKNHTIDVTNELNSLLAEVETLRDQDMALLQDSVAELQDFRDETAAASGAGGGAGGSGANDAHFHQRISMLESRMEDIKGEVQLVVMDCIDDVAKASDLDDLTAAVDAEKASKEEVRQLAQQQAQLALSVNSVAECVAEMRADGGGGGAASGATRFKCLTCNSELDGPRGGAGGGVPHQQATAVQQRERERGAFLPRLEGAGAGQAHGHPIGPGLSAAEFRKRASPSATSPLRGTDFAEYSTGGGGGAAKGGPTTRTADGRVAVTIPAGGLRIPAGPKTPVFIA